MPTDSWRQWTLDLAEQVLATANDLRGKNGRQRHFGMKAHIGLDVASGMMHTVQVTRAGGWRRIALSSRLAEPPPNETR